MKQKDLVRFIESHGAEFKRHGSNHDIYVLGKKRTSVPRHKEVDENTAKGIFKQLGITV